MDEQVKLFLNSVRDLPGYKAFEELVASARPCVPRYDFRNENTEEWKVKSGRQEGYELFASLLNIKFED